MLRKPELSAGPWATWACIKNLHMKLADKKKKEKKKTNSNKWLWKRVTNHRTNLLILQRPLVHKKPGWICIYLQNAEHKWMHRYIYFYKSHRVPSSPSNSWRHITQRKNAHKVKGREVAHWNSLTELKRYKVQGKKKNKQVAASCCLLSCYTLGMKDLSK